MRILQYILICFTLLFITNCSKDDSQVLPPDDVVITPVDTIPLAYKSLLNVSYGNDAEQVYDIYLPKDRTQETKVIILVHGGGWTSGDKNDMNPFKIFLENDLPDYAIVNMNYRLADENKQPYPMQINDISSVIDHLKKNTTEYVISNNYGFMGVSAGAHLSLLWTYAFDNEKNINMVASIVGPTNLNAPEYVNSDSPELEAMIKLFGIDPTPEYLKEISPYHQVTATAPPTILFNGGEDPLIPTNQGIDLDKKLTALDIIHEFTLYPEEGHGWEGANLFDTWFKLKIFTQKHL